jgi:hypothetical protein
MTVEEFEKIMDDESIKTIIVDIEECSTFAGLKVITKYLPGAGISGADHDIVYSANVSDLIEAGITREDTIKLKELNWMIEDGYLACFV